MRENVRPFLIELLVLLVCILLCQWACGQTVERIGVVTQDHDVRFGTAACICKAPDGSLYWLTCWHVVHEAKVLLINGHEAKLVTSNRSDDTALVVTTPIDGAVPFRLDSRLSGYVRLVGYGPAGRRREWSGKVMANVDAAGMAVLLGGAQLGDSGGPCISQGGALCGMISASDLSTISVVVRPGTIRKLLDAAGFSEKPKCEGGNCPIQ